MPSRSRSRSRSRSNPRSRSRSNPRSRSHSNPRSRSRSRPRSRSRSRPRSRSRSMPRTNKNWNKLRDVVLYSPYQKHKKLGMRIPSNLRKDDWLKYHGYQNTMEFDDHATMDDYRRLNDQWNLYSMEGGGNYAGAVGPEYAEFLRGGYGPSPLRGGANGIAGALGMAVASNVLRGGYKKRSSKKSKKISKSKKSKSKRSKSKKSKSKKSK